jgi:hypothetical protein
MVPPTTFRSGGAATKLFGTADAELVPELRNRSTDPSFDAGRIPRLFGDAEQPQ